MAAGAWRRCSNPDCHELHQGTGQCPACTAQGDRGRRPQGNPYTTRGHRSFRRAVLDRDPICVVCGIAVATVADHYPVERRDLVAQGLDPNDPARGRGLCATCHARTTAQRTPGGWNARE